MSNEVVAQTEVTELLKNLPVNAEHTADVFHELAEATKYLPRLQLFGSNSGPCKMGTFPVNHYGLVVGKDKILDLGKTVDILPIRWRPKALEFLSDGSILNKYDHKDPEFVRILEKSKVPNSKAMYGPEYLVWIPVLARFAGYFMGSVSSRMEAPNLSDKMNEGVAATLTSKFVQNKKGSWQTPVVESCSSPVDPMPEMTKLQAEVLKFVNPPKDEIEAVDEAETANSRAR